MLEGLGCTVEVVNDGQEALDKLEKAVYEVIFMDCQMPVLDGYKATGEIRRREGEEQHTPIIAMTANAMAGDREKCLAAGMDDYIAKPVKKKNIVDVLIRWVTQSEGKVTESAAS